MTGIEETGSGTGILLFRANRGATAGEHRLPRLSRPRPDLLRGAGGPHRLLPRGVRRPPAVDGRTRLCGPRRPVPDATRPTSSQVGIGIGLTKAGLAGAVAAWVGFTAPSAILLIALGYGVVASDDGIPAGLLRGLGAVVVAVVAQAVWGMARTLCPDPPRVTIAVLAAAAVLGVGGAPAQVAVIATGGLVGFLCLRDETAAAPEPGRVAPVSVIAIASLVLFFVLLVLLPVLASTWPSQGLALADSFYRSGSLVFGGGHVVLALLKAEVLPTGWVPEDVFLAGYGAAQAVPGPLFTFSAYLGTVMEQPPSGVGGGLICSRPSSCRRFCWSSAPCPGGTRCADWSRPSGPCSASRSGRRTASCRPVRSGVDERSALGGRLRLALAGFALLVSWRLPPWLVVLLGALAGWGGGGDRRVEAGGEGRNRSGPSKPWPRTRWRRQLGSADVALGDHHSTRLKAACRQPRERHPPRRLPPRTSDSSCRSLDPAHGAQCIRQARLRQ